MAKILSGIPLRDKIKVDLSTVVSLIPEHVRPILSIIQVGSLAASTTYIQGKMKFAKEIGISIQHHVLPNDVSDEEVIDLILILNTDLKVGGILVQLPLPTCMNKEKILESIDPEKDVDGLHSVNIKKHLVNDDSGIVPATTKGIHTLLDFYGIPLKGRRILMVGRSDLVGKPTAIALLNRDATVTVAHHLSVDLPALCREADIIITATGVPGLIGKDHVKAGQIVIDVGITKQDEKIVGDVSFAEVLSIVAAVSPVPGGVGPLTIASLFQNLLRKYTSGITK